MFSVRLHETDILCLDSIAIGEIKKRKAENIVVMGKINKEFENFETDKVNIYLL